MFAHRSAQKELLDRNDIPFEDIKTNMDELNTINKWLGGHATVLKGVQKILQQYPQQWQWHIAEIGCGDGNNIRYLKKHFPHFRFTGIDINAHCIAAAQKLDEQVHWITAPYHLSLENEMQPDIIFSSLFTHHFNNEEIIAQINWMQQQARKGFFIVDLHRHPFAYYGILLLTKIFSKSYLVRNDAPLSVLRACTKKEWRQLIQHSECPQAKIEWQWAFRFLISCSK